MELLRARVLVAGDLLSGSEHTLHSLGLGLPDFVTKKLDLVSQSISCSETLIGDPRPGEERSE